MPQATLTSTADKPISRSVFTPDEGHSYFDMSPAQVAARITSLNVAAGIVAGGGGLTDRRLADTVTVDLLDTAAWLARQLTNFFDDQGD